MFDLLTCVQTCGQISPVDVTEWIDEYSVEIQELPEDYDYSGPLGIRLLKCQRIKRRLRTKARWIAVQEAVKIRPYILHWLEYVTKRKEEHLF